MPAPQGKHQGRGELVGLNFDRVDRDDALLGELLGSTPPPAP